MAVLEQLELRDATSCQDCQILSGQEWLTGSGEMARPRLLPRLSLLALDLLSLIRFIYVFIYFTFHVRLFLFACFVLFSPALYSGERSVSVPALRSDSVQWMWPNLENKSNNNRKTACD